MNRAKLCKARFRQDSPRYTYLYKSNQLTNRRVLNLAMVAWLVVLSVATNSVPGRAASESNDLFCGTYPNRVLSELGLHTQFQQHRATRGFLPLRDATTAAFDVGNIAVLPDDGTLVTSQNPFDLDGRSLTFDPSGTGYTVRVGAAAFDTVATEQGELLNPAPATNPQNIGDDGARSISLPFVFRFFGQTYTTVFVNSDGNLTFVQGDTSTTARSLARFLTGPPRIAPYFADLDPSLAGRLTVFTSSTRVVVSWTAVPDFVAAGTGPRETFQVTMNSDGLIEMAYGGISGREAVVGISQGNLNATPAMVDFSATSGAVVIQNAIAEVFSLTTELDLAAVTRRFYQTHDDAYENIVIFSNFNFNLNGAFAFEVNISNQVTGIGRIGNTTTFDFSGQFGSAGRLESLLNMGSLSRYPSDPSTVFLGANSTLSVMGQEAGHRFLSYVTWADPAGAPNSTALLGRELQHWSFYFNSDASVMEGNLIRDNNNGTFTTTGVVQKYNEIDQYLMGLRAPDEVGPSFLVKNPSPSLNPGTSPFLNANFSGTRANVELGQIIASNGPRIPNSVIAPKRFNYAFVLVTGRNTPATADEIAKVDLIRREWESFFNRSVGFRGTANTSLTHSLRLQPNPLGLLNGATVTGRIALGSPAPDSISFNMTTSNSAAVRVPATVNVPAGAAIVEFPITGMGVGRSLLEANAAGFQTASSVVEVVSPLTSARPLTLEILQGNNQSGPTGGTLPIPLRVRLRDANSIPYAGVGVQFIVITVGGATIPAPVQMTSELGIAEAQIQLGGFGPVTIIANVGGLAAPVTFTIFSVDGPFVTPLGVVNGASFAPAGVIPAPGSIFSIFGTRLASTVASAASLPLTTTLGGTRVEIDGLAVPLFYVSPTQINAQSPTDLAASLHSLVVRNDGIASPAITVNARQASPGIFSLNSSGIGTGAITHAGTATLVSSEQPAVPGQYVSVFATGLGATTPRVTSGQPAPTSPLSRTALAVTATVRGIPAVVDFAGLAPGFAGLYQVNLQVPEILPGPADVILTTGGVASNTVTMEVGSR